MKEKSHILFILLIIILPLLAFLFSKTCDINFSESKAGINQNDSLIISIDTFNNIPEEFSHGGGCIYSKIKNGQPIFIDDVNGNAIMKINGEMVRFKWEEINGYYYSNNYQVLIESYEVDKAHESSTLEGNLTIFKNDAVVIKIKIYGNCGA